MTTPRVQHDQKLLFTFESAARALGIRSALLRRAADRGQVRTVEVGRRRLIPKPELARLSAGAISEGKDNAERRE
jgi:hypothetical protein